MSDGSHHPIVEPKVEVIPVSDSPVIRADPEETEKQVDEKPLEAHHPANHSDVGVGRGSLVKCEGGRQTRTESL